MSTGNQQKTRDVPQRMNVKLDYTITATNKTTRQNMTFATTKMQRVYLPNCAVLLISGSTINSSDGACMVNVIGIVVTEPIYGPSWVNTIEAIALPNGNMDGSNVIGINWILDGINVNDVTEESNDSHDTSPPPVDEMVTVTCSGAVPLLLMVNSSLSIIRLW